ncbi:virB8 family protein [Lysobacter antibioticus]|uniref:VirB8 family protein n=1 Tax=Lysobacter antibioticus TaxID=84531 RepID=A0A0S2FAH1_LYSAN|nr:type IV secretion system protein [Lysobacter antibioticus]ALN80528.1 virB8 family protein [Lysobacter antibioticus]
MFGKKPVTPQIENAVAKAANYEVTVADIARRSERRAWMVAFASLVMSLILAGGYFYFLPLKEKVPYLVMADAYTGTSTVARLRDDFVNPSIASSEAINKSNISHFVMARESYDHSQIGERDWNTVFAMAAPHVTSGYSQLYGNTNPNNPITIFGKAKTVRVKILSIQLNGEQNTGPKPKVATVRFQRSVLNKDTGSSEPLDSKIATIEYLYKSNLKMDERNRVLNPLGFQVTGYRVDNDYAASPPIQSEYPTTPGAAPAPAAPQGQLMPDGTMAPAPAYPSAPGAAPPAPGAAPGYPPTAPAPPGQPGAPVPPNPAANPATTPAAPAPAPTGNANGVSNR